jgi:hypothetical protein
MRGIKIFADSNEKGMWSLTLLMPFTVKVGE